MKRKSGGVEWRGWRGDGVTRRVSHLDVLADEADGVLLDGQIRCRHRRGRGGARASRSVVPASESRSHDEWQQLPVTSRAERGLF